MGEPCTENELSLEDHPEAQRRNSIHSLEEYIGSLPQAALPLRHHFSKGLYCRELDIPKGTILVGKIHKHETLNILAQGDISLFTEDGVKRVQAPYIVVSRPGIKRVGYAHTDCVWINVHATEERDLEKIEDEVIAKDYGDVAELSGEQLKQLKDIAEEEA